MSFFDFLKKSEPAKKQADSNSSNTGKNMSADHSVSQSNTVKHSIAHRDIVTVKPKKNSLKVSNTVDLEKNLKPKCDFQKIKITFYCPIRKAKIFCHSILIDKLGDLTKFMIVSLYEGHTLEEISLLTKMGNTTVKEELEYLVRGGLINDDRKTLTDLGKQYGILLEKFDELSDGIDVSFNVFADKFEPVKEEQYVNTPENKYIAEGHFIPALARNDNYSNSLEIAKKQIESDTPFCQEICNSLYTVVKIAKSESAYKPMCIKNFNRGYSSENDFSVRIAIPCEKVTYKPHYKWLDEFRKIIPQLSDFNENYTDFLSDKAKLVLSMAKEENEAENITKTINTITGDIIRNNEELCEQLTDHRGFVLDKQMIQLVLDGDACNEIYLEEISRESLYLIRYFSYDRMEE